MPHMEAGLRTDCALSVPMEARHKSAATAAAEPPLEPACNVVDVPGIVCRAVERIDRRAAERPFVHVGFAEQDRAGRLSAALHRRGIEVREPNRRESSIPAVVLTPRVDRLSLIENGMPCSGPRYETPVYFSLRSSRVGERLLFGQRLV